MKALSNMFGSSASIDNSMNDGPEKAKTAKGQEAQPGMRVWMPVEDDDIWALATVTGKSFGGKVAVKRSRAPRGAPLRRRSSRDAPRQTMCVRAGTKMETQLPLETFNSLDLCTGDADAGAHARAHRRHAPAWPDRPAPPRQASTTS